MEIKKISIRKKAQGHVEMILSFVIFIGFVFVILFFINPIQKNQISYSVVDEIQQKIFDNISINYKSASVILADKQNDCFKIKNTLNEESKSLAKDIQGNAIESFNDVNENFIYIEHQDKDERFYRLYFSDNFNDYPLRNEHSCEEKSENEYTFGVLSFEKAVLYENLVYLNDYYLLNYDELKKSLNIDKNFEFVVYNSTRGVLMNETLTKHKTRATNVLSREIPVMVIDKNATLSQIIFNIRVW